MTPLRHNIHRHRRKDYAVAHELDSFKSVLNPDTMMDEMADICKLWGFVATE
jgi:hypothetical protein